MAPQRRPRTLEDLLRVGAESEGFLRLENARVLIADYERILRDFPWLRATSADRDSDREVVNRWLLNNAAVVSTSQAAQALVNSPIYVEGGVKIQGARPAGHGRSAIVLAPDAASAGGHRGLISVKGLGVSDRVKPTFGPQRNGLLPLYCALYEFAMHKLVSGVFRHAGSPHRVLPAYAVLDAGFDELQVGPGASPAGLLVRQAHFRSEEGIDLPRLGSIQQRAAANAEFVLRQYGITSNSTSPWLHLRQVGEEVAVRRGSSSDTELYPHVAARHIEEIFGTRADSEVDGISLQFTRDLDWFTGGLEIVDLHFAVKSRFTRPVVSTVCDSFLGIGGILDIDHASYVQPAPRLMCRPPWGVVRIPTSDEISKFYLTPGEPFDAATAEVMEIARLARLGANSQEITERLLAMVNNTINQWPGNSKASSESCS